MYTMGYYSAIERNETVPFAEMWMDPQDCHRELTKPEREKQILYINAYMWNLEK